MREVDVCGHDGHTYRVNLRVPGGEYHLVEVPFCEYAMRGSPRAHPALLVFSNTVWMYATPTDMSLVGTSEGPGVNIVYRRSHLANTQYEAVRGRIPPC